MRWISDYDPTSQPIVIAMIRARAHWLRHETDWHTPQSAHAAAEEFVRASLTGDTGPGVDTTSVSGPTLHKLFQHYLRR